MDLSPDVNVVSTTTTVPHNGSNATLVDSIEAELGDFTPTTEVDEIVFSVAPPFDEKKTDDDNTLEKRLSSTPPTVPALPPVENDRLVAPDGGAVAWCQVLAGFLLNSVAWGTSMTFGIYQLYYTQTLGLDSASVSWIGSVQTFLTYFLSTVSGLLADAGYAREVSAVGTVLVAAGGLGISFAAPAAPAHFVSGQPVPPALLLCQAIIMGVGLGLLTAPALPSMNSFFDKRRPLALAISTTGTCAGGTLLLIGVQFLLPAVGFGWAVRCVTLVSIVVCAVAALLLRPPLTAVVVAKKEPISSTPSSSSSSSSSVSPKSRSFAARASWLLHQIVDVSALHEVPTLLFIASTFLLYWGLYFGFYYIDVYAEDVVGFTTDGGTMLLVMSLTIGIPARLAAGSIAGACTSALDLLIVATIVMAATVFAWIGVGSSTSAMYVFVAFFGTGNGAVQSVWVSSIAELSRHAGSRIGARFGMFCSVAALATLAGAPTASALISLTNKGNMVLASTYRIAQIWGAATTLVSAGVLVVARIYATGWHLKRT
ncbi:hypothetical protein SEPCBS57363_004499 [Sporothrix epigloea]|uniref:Major facilitator superfamily transporter monocarboxylate n=1 Tax=Sporothrix epigloea TaxID=1892477 RepID=A0ABP0DSM6_9PEZI